MIKYWIAFKDETKKYCSTTYRLVGTGKPVTQIPGEEIRYFVSEEFYDNMREMYDFRIRLIEEKSERVQKSARQSDTLALAMGLFFFALVLIQVFDYVWKSR